MFRTQGRHGLTLYPDRATSRSRCTWSTAPMNRSRSCGGRTRRHVSRPVQSSSARRSRRDGPWQTRGVGLPIATGTLLQGRLLPGTDISRYDTFPYRRRTGLSLRLRLPRLLRPQGHAGLLHVADHSRAGQEAVDLGNGPFGWSWDRQLTTTMAVHRADGGAYTDNQPTSLGSAGEEKSFTQVFMPYKQIGPPKTRARRPRSISSQGPSRHIGVYVSAPRESRCALADAEPLHERSSRSRPRPTSARPCPPPSTRAATDPGSLEPAHGSSLHAPRVTPPIPDPHRREAAAEIGLARSSTSTAHLEQYRHATYPEPYTRRRCAAPGRQPRNTAMARRLIVAASSRRRAYRRGGPLTLRIPTGGRRGSLPSGRCLNTSNASTRLRRLRQAFWCDA